MVGKREVLLHWGEPAVKCTLNQYRTYGLGWPAILDGGAVYTIDYIYIYAWNPNDPCFDWKRPCFAGLTFKNRGYFGSSCIYIYKCVDFFYSRIKTEEYCIYWVLPKYWKTSGNPEGF